MPDEELSPEEQTALAEMENETPDEPVTDGEAKDEPRDQDPPAGEDESKPDEAEFKTQREKPEGDKPPEGYVPHQAMHAERVKRQELEREIAEIKARLPQEEAEKPPEWVDPLVDPEGFRKWDAYQREQASKPVEEMRQQLQEQAKMQERLQRVQTYEAQFKATTPDYDDAVRHLQTQRVNELRGLGYDDNTIGAQISKDINQLFDAAEMIGMNPAQLAYMRAQEAGWKKPAPQPATDEGEKITALDTARRQTQGLGSTGAPQSGKPTAAQIAEMSEAEIAKLTDDDLKAAFGG